MTKQNDQDYIRSGVELAEGWYDIFYDYESGHIHGPFQQTRRYTILSQLACVAV